ncbi:MAG: 2-C-methyl-D-erythritol 2,4-cyclodiphosphate synthase [Candidatus Krumholzibacteriota bacterium]|nr:2-C-methyl-D-erythritol 2,4-cyclodiphosphate synthase [Candidatus Krumholzibacteriota bacterium]
MRSNLRIGTGYDIHPLLKGRDLVLGGVHIENEAGLDGHSDADALLHAVSDALLGALSLGDLGMHFPETKEYRGASSILLLGKVYALVTERGYRLVNLDCIVHAENPVIAPYREAMIEKIAAVLCTAKENVSVKATRGEGMGPIGEKRAIAARAVVLLEKTDE